MKIRPATMKDALPVKMLWAVGEEARAGQDIPEPFVGGDLDTAVERIADNSVLVAEDEKGCVCGFVAFMVTGIYYAGLNVVVAPDCQHHGVGRALVESAHAEAKSRGARKALTLLWKDSGMLPFYESVGYRATGYALTKEF